MKIDLKKTVPTYSARAGAFAIIEVPPMSYLMIDGEGDPNSAPEYADAVRSIYSVAYKLKFLSKRELDRDYVVPPLEALWWADDMDSFTATRDKSRWHWTLLNLVPDWVEPGLVDRAREAADAPLGERLRFAVLDEGLCVQTLHVGSYDDEAPVLAAMHDEFIPDEGLRMTGRHHEIYLSDPRRVAPAKLRTILRQPVERS
ncbi:GyrI-like domain-containing protein [Microbacterium sp. NPDC055910]|uniref:GyrI-like domain-containing protein n=1 Tax=Microbacterium sp. NPDC055910 TaxID=3345659 RepID=UPI0035DD12DA